MRSYVDAKQVLDNAKSQADLKHTPMMDMVWEVQQLIMEDRKAKRER